MKNDPIYCWISQGRGWVRVSGDGCYLNAPQVRDFGREMTRRGIWNIVVELQECTGLDSTFIGTLAGVALRLLELGKGSLQVVNASAQHEKQLRDLGLDKLFKL